jgi:hypothetical protein
MTVRSGHNEASRLRRDADAGDGAARELQKVWIDDVQVFDLHFSRPEMVELSKLITLADVKLQNGQIGDCLRLLEGCWPRFLRENVPLPAGAAVPEEVATEPPSPNEEKPTDRGWFNRMKDMLPDSIRF